MNIMTIKLLPLVQYPDGRLNEIGFVISEIDEGIRLHMQRMVLALQQYGAAGIAAVQLGSRLQAIAINCEGSHGLVRLINPRIVEKHGIVTHREGCLSFPGVALDIERAAQVRVEAQLMDGDVIDFDARGTFAVVLQHEIDHCKGVTFIKHVDPQRKAKAIDLVNKIRLQTAKVAFESVT